MGYSALEERSSWRGIDCSNVGMESLCHNLSAREVTMMEGRGLNGPVTLRNILMFLDGFSLH